MTKYERYELLFSSNDALEFRFNSIGPKGVIAIVVQFNKTDDSGVYNLSFGNLLEDGSIDDCIRNGNHDRNKVLATVAGAVFEFTSTNPGMLIFFSGSTPARTRLYRMALTLNFNELSVDFEIFGVNLSKFAFLVEEFKNGKEYYGFLIKRKNI